MPANLAYACTSNSPASQVERTPTGTQIISNGSIIKSKDTVIATSAYDRRVYPPVGRAVLPVATYIAGTERLGDRVRDAICTEAAIYDHRRAGDYYRVVEGDRILWGGRITTATSEPTRLANLMHRDMCDVYPQLADVRMDYAWSGLVGYCRHFMPIIAEIEPNIWTATAFGGHGLNTTAMAGSVIARAIATGGRRVAQICSLWSGLGRRSAWPRGNAADLLVHAGPRSH